jgi:hypothetical protein
MVLWPLLALIPGIAAALAPAGELGDRVVLLSAAVAGSLVLLMLGLAARGAVHLPRLSVVLLGAALLRLLPLAGPPRFDDDLWRYLWDGAATTACLSPYRFAPQQVRDFDPVFDPLLLAPAELRELERLVARAQDGRLRAALERINFPFYPTLYPPTSQAAFALTAALAPGSERLWRAFAALADLAAAGLLVLLLRRLGRPTWWAAAYALHPLPALESAAAGHQDALGIALLLAAAFLLLGRRRAWAGALLSASAGVKLFPALLLAAWARSLRCRGLLAAAAAAAALGLPFLWLGAPRLEGLQAYVGRWEFFSGPYALLALLGGDRNSLAVLLIGLALLCRPWRAREPAATVALGLGWVEALVLLSPVVDPWYVPWALAAGATRGSTAWPLFGLLVPLAYVPFAPAAEHSWQLRLLAWLPAAALLAAEALRARSALR